MEMVVNENARIVEFWLRSDEAALREQLKPEFAAWKSRGYLSAVFLSGDKDLYRQTSDLLCCNRKRLAELEVQKAKALRAAMSY